VRGEEINEKDRETHDDRMPWIEEIHRLTFTLRSKKCEAVFDKKFLKKQEVDPAAMTATLDPITMKNRTLSAIVALLSTLSLAHAATLEVDKGRSRIQVDAKATGHNFTGTLKEYSASVSGDSGSLAPQGFKLEWNFNDLDTDDAKRDKEMIKWLGGGNPKGSFKFTKSWIGKDGSQQAMGTLTINGVSKTVSFPYTAQKDGEWVTVDGKVSMDYRNFSLPVIRAMAVMTVDPKLDVRFHVVGKVK
jgi:polyisoprenoid-binding protein YceI